MGFGGLGRLLVFSGLILVAVGGVLWVIEKGAPPGLGWIGRLPGDIFIQRKNFTFYFPLATGLILSVILSVILWLITRR
jgi:hypothetical protein